MTSSSQGTQGTGIPKLRKSEMQAAEGTENNDSAVQEIKQVQSGKSVEQLRKEADEAEHNRTEAFRNHFHIVVEEVAATDSDPAGFVATNDELGLVVEADSLDELLAKVKETAPLLFELNVLPDLQNERENIRPAFNLSHLLGKVNSPRYLSIYLLDT